MSMPPKDDLQTQPIADLEKRLGSSPEGLTAAEAATRLAKDGPNELPLKKENELLKFLSYFWGPIPWMIEIAVILSGVVGHWPDFFIILLLLCTNAVVGFSEEHSAGNAIAALKAKLATKTRVKRDGKWVTPPARGLVAGDVIQLKLGDIVPADARLLDGDPMSVDQSALTGESLPTTKNVGEAVFSGSIVRRGQSDALVYATGGKTYFGKTAKLVEQAPTLRLCLILPSANNRVVGQADAECTFGPTVFELAATQALNQYLHRLTMFRHADWHEFDIARLMVVGTELGDSIANVRPGAMVVELDLGFL